LKPRTQIYFKNREQAAFSRELALICQDVPVHISLEECLERDFDSNVVRNKFVELEFRSLINKIPESLDDKKNKEMQVTEQMGLFGSMQDVGSLSYSNNADFPTVLSDASRLFLMFVNAEEGDSAFLGIKVVIRRKILA
jgi:5'-3' exonuclease